MVVDPYELDEIRPTRHSRGAIEKREAVPPQPFEVKSVAGIGPVPEERVDAVEFDDPLAGVAEELH
jgi:hypothetical protein